MNTVLIWLIPPVVGAIIGYVTNLVAIKMLFRPLEEYRIFGIRIPFTPGVLPRQRRKLAESIGGMVERELLTPEILRERLSRPEVLESLKNALSVYTEKLINLPAEKWLPNISSYIVSGAEAVYPHAAKAAVSFLKRKDINDLLETQFRLMITKAVLNMNVLQRLVISAGQYDVTIKEKVPEIITDLVKQLEKLLQSEEGSKKILGNIETEILSLHINKPDLCLNRFFETQKIYNTEKINEGNSTKNQLDSFLAEKILNTVISETETVLKTINVRNLVSERINSLDMIRVEKIILDVMAGQLWWINVVGGVLGFLIGITQSILSIFL